MIVGSKTQADTRDVTRFASGSQSLTRAIRDIVQALKQWRLWGMLGWLDIRQRYRRSLIGPFWITISMGIMVAALGFVYSTLLGAPMAELLPYLAGGFIAWALISAMMIEGAAVFTSSEPFIKHGNVPLFLHSLRLFWRHAITFAHNLAILIGVYIIFQFWPATNLLLFPVTFALVSAILVVWATIIGALSARFRDLPPIIGSIVQVVFFITPILYKPEMLASDRAFVYEFNPFYYMIEGLRAPLLGEPISLELILTLLLILLVSSVLGLLVFARTRGRIAYWL